MGQPKINDLDPRFRDISIQKHYVFRLKKKRSAIIYYAEDKVAELFFPIPEKNPAKPRDDWVVAREDQENKISWFRFSWEQTCARDSGASGFCGRGLQGRVTRSRLGRQEAERRKPTQGVLSRWGWWRAVPLGNLRRSSTEFSSWSRRESGHLSIIPPTPTACTAKNGFCGHRLWCVQLPGQKPDVRQTVTSVQQQRSGCVSECWRDPDGVLTALLQ